MSAKLSTVKTGQRPTRPHSHHIQWNWKRFAWYSAPSPLKSLKAFLHKFIQSCYYTFKLIKTFSILKYTKKYFLTETLPPLTPWRKLPWLRPTI